MKAKETTRKFHIKVIDDNEYEPDKDFFVSLCDYETKEQLIGADTKCTVTILDEDQPGIIGFRDRNIKVRRKD